MDMCVMWPVFGPVLPLTKQPGFLKKGSRAATNIKIRKIGENA